MTGWVWKAHMMVISLVCLSKGNMHYYWWFVSKKLFCGLILMVVRVILFMRFKIGRGLILCFFEG